MSTLFIIKHTATFLLSKYNLWYLHKKKKLFTLLKVEFVKQNSLWLTRIFACFLFALK